MKTPRRTFISFDKRLCLLSYYQLQGSRVWIGTSALREKMQLLNNVNHLFSKLKLISNKSCVTKASRLPRKGMILRLIFMFLITLSFIPPFLVAFIIIPITKFSKVNSHRVHVSVKRALNTQDDFHEYFTNFDSDTKLAVLDNAANVSVWNWQEDFVNFKTISPNQLPDNVKTIGDGVLPSEIGDVPVIFKGDNQVKHEIVLKNTFYFPKSEVNLISIAELATLFPDESGEPDKESPHS